MQAAKAAASTRHSNDDPGSSEVKLKLAVVVFVGSAGFAVIVAVGGVVSIVQVCVAGDGSVLPAASRRADVERMAALSEAGIVLRLVHALNAAPSRRHSKVAPPSGEAKVKLAAVEFVGFAGFVEIVVSGPTVTIVQLKVAVLPVLPAGSVALTWKLWGPSARLL